MSSLKLIGKAKEDFEEWFTNQELNKNPDNKDWADAAPQWVYNILSESMQWGVYVDFFDSKEIFIDIDYAPTWGNGYHFNAELVVNRKEREYIGEYLTREDARIGVFERANQIYNTNHE